jgi:predicted enzyme related to lactoylglutathione lyase
MIKVSSIVIGVSDLRKAKIFYENVFGFTFQEFRPPFSSAMFDGIEFNIEENSKDRSGDWRSKYLGGRKSVGFKTDNLKAFLESAQAHGAHILQPPKEMPWGWREAVIADQDSNEFLIEEEL